uniref:Capsid protein n=1 Tax=Norovirus sheep/Norsewood30/2007/NZL TaxID=479341 RepID=A8W787_NORV|nr:capsid protein [Norovirus sheep/Norsewood30/2007/NZL]
MKMSDKESAESPASLGQVLPPQVDVVVPVEPTVGAQIAAPTAGQINPIDPWIFSNFVQAPQGEFTISPNNNPGEILFEMELGPDLNPYLGHLRRMYNGWTGSLRVRVMLAGNAFSAGKIIVFCIPPGFDTTFLTPAQATQFPHVIMDVRAPDPVEVPLEDVRNVLFHQGPDNRMRLVGMLYTPLRANSGADPFVVTGRVLTCPSENFSFFFLVPPTVEEKDVPFTIPNVPTSSLTNSRMLEPVAELRSSRNFALSVQFQNGRSTIEGELLGTTPASLADLGSFLCIRGGTANLAELFQPNEDAFVAGSHPAPFGFPDFSNCTLDFLLYDANGLYHRHLDVTSASNFTPALGHITLDGSVPDRLTRARLEGVQRASENTFWRMPDYRGDVLGAEFAPAVSAPGIGETLLFFMSNVPYHNGSNPNPLPCLLPLEWINHFVAERPAKQSDVALLNYINPLTGRVLFECKLYSAGFLAVNLGSQTEVTLPVDGIFKFVSWVSYYYQLRPVGTVSVGRRLPRLDGH